MYNPAYNPVDAWDTAVQQHAILTKIAVVGPKHEQKVRQLAAAISKGPVAPTVVLAPKVVIMPVNGPPENLYPVTIIPLEVRAPTAALLSEQFGSGAGAPWSTAPASMVLAAATIGSLMVMVGRQVIAQMAMTGGEAALSEMKKRYERRDVQFRFMTGQSEGGKGNIVRPRGEGGEIPEGTNPYEDPDDFTWFKPWTWF